MSDEPYNPHDDGKEPAKLWELLRRNEKFRQDWKIASKHVQEGGVNLGELHVKRLMLSSPYSVHLLYAAQECRKKGHEYPSADEDWLNLNPTFKLVFYEGYYSLDDRGVEWRFCSTAKWDESLTWIESCKDRILIALPFIPSITKPELKATLQNVADSIAERFQLRDRATTNYYGTKVEWRDYLVFSRSSGARRQRLEMVFDQYYGIGSTRYGDKSTQIDNNVKRIESLIEQIYPTQQLPSSMHQASQK